MRWRRVLLHPQIIPHHRPITVLQSGQLVSRINVDTIKTDSDVGLNDHPLYEVDVHFEAPPAYPWPPPYSEESMDIPIQNNSRPAGNAS